MGHNAYAYLVVGVDFGCVEDGDEAPEWLLKLAPPAPTGGDDYEEPSMYDIGEAIEKLLGNEFGKPDQVELHSYGYHDLPHHVLGIRVAHAGDYTSASVDLEKVAYDLPTSRSRVRAVLRQLGAPPDVEIGVHLCPGA